MDSGTIDLSDTPGGLDLRATLESGQTYLWWRAEGDTYAGGPAEEWYLTTDRIDDESIAIAARQIGDVLEWRATADADSLLRHRLGLGDDLPAIRATAPEDDLIETAFDAAWGLRIVREPPFAGLISFICSTQMRVERIFGMQQALRDAFGQTLDLDGWTVTDFPTPTALAGSTETRLRELGLGYRAPYVLETARMVANDEAHPANAADREYEAAREYLTQFVGVGEKVADCVLLFSLGELSAVPLDTWIQRTVNERWPDLAGESYAETSRAVREYLGPYAGYAQTYVFHHVRTGQAVL
ncbi:MAG: DNA-3-methyladenine glycosylase [Salinirussus sp.]